MEELREAGKERKTAERVSSLHFITVFQGMWLRGAQSLMNSSRLVQNFGRIAESVEGQRDPGVWMVTCDGGGEWLVERLIVTSFVDALPFSEVVSASWKGDWLFEKWTWIGTCGRVDQLLGCSCLES